MRGNGPFLHVKPDCLRMTQNGLWPECGWTASLGIGLKQESPTCRERRASLGIGVADLSVPATTTRMNCTLRINLGHQLAVSACMGAASRRFTLGSSRAME